jgi:hypothetical protein
MEGRAALFLDLVTLVILGAGERLFEGVGELNLEQLGALEGTRGSAPQVPRREVMGCCRG